MKEVNATRQEKFKICEWCIANGYKQTSNDWFVKKVNEPIPNEPQIQIYVRCALMADSKWLIECSMEWYKFRCDIQDIISIRKNILKLDELIEFTNKATELNNIANEFKLD